MIYEGGGDENVQKCTFSLTYRNFEISTLVKNAHFYSRLLFTKTRDIHHKRGGRGPLCYSPGMYNFFATLWRNMQRTDKNNDQ